LSCSRSAPLSQPQPLPDRSGTGVRHLNQVQLARRWSISPRTLERWRWSGEGPAYLKIGGRVLYRLADIEHYEHEQLRTAQLGAEASADNRTGGRERMA